MVGNFITGSAAGGGTFVMNVNSPMRIRGSVNMTSVNISVIIEAKNVPIGSAMLTIDGAATMRGTLVINVVSMNFTRNMTIVVAQPITRGFDDLVVRSDER